MKAPSVLEGACASALRPGPRRTRPRDLVQPWPEFPPLSQAYLKTAADFH